MAKDITTRKKILIVEDDAIIATDLKNTMKTFGYDVLDTVARGEKVFPLVKKTPPDLILTDIKLAGKLNGIETVKQVHAAFDIPVVFLSPYGEELLLEKATSSETYGYLIKPYEEKELRNTIEMALIQHGLKKELKERTAELKKEIAERKRGEEALKESEERWRSLAENSPDHIMLVDLDYTILDINRTAPDLTKEEVIGTSQLKFVPQEFHQTTRNCYKLIKKTGKPSTYFTEYKTVDGEIRTFEVRVGPVFRDEKVIAFISSSTDITKREKREAELKRKNLALGEVIAQVETEKRKIGEEVALNISKLVLPILDKMKSDPTAIQYLPILEKNLRRLTSKFGQEISSKEINLSPREIEICNYIRNGLASKEIAAILGTSPQTVEKQRKRIRKKLGITEKSTNLVSVLQKMGL